LRRSNRSICSFAQRSRKKSISLMKILMQLVITLRDHALDWYMSLDTNIVPRTTRTLSNIKKLYYTTTLQ
jgi:hypothetical protein